MLTPNELENLRQRMGEAAALPSHHPQRLALLREITAAGGEIEAEWLRLLQQDEMMRLELARVPVPQGLEERLLAIPDEHAHRLAWSIRSPRRVLAMTASLLILGATLAFLLLPKMQTSRVLDQIAAAAMVGHERAPDLSVTGTDWQPIAASFGNQVAFPLRRPEQLSSNLRLVGGAATTMHGHRVIYTRWTDGDRTCSLYSCCRTDFGITPPLAARTMTRPSNQGRGSAEIRIWSEGHGDYALVMDAQEGSDPVNRKGV